MIDLVKVLRTGERVPVTRRTKVGEKRGWAVAAHIIRERLPMWAVAAGLDPPDPPAVDGFDDLPAIIAVLRALPVRDAISLPLDVQDEGLRLALATHKAVLRAVETALEHADYPRADVARLCRVENELERVLPMLAALAVQRHRDLGVEGSFDLAPWVDATDALATRLSQ